jgi:hypothetical protein
MQSSETVGRVRTGVDLLTLGDTNRQAEVFGEA